MVVIKKKSNVIPIDFGEFKFEITLNDDIAKYLLDLQKKYTKEIDENDLEQLKDISISVWDDVFGEGSGNKVYEFANQSSILSINYFTQAVEGILDEWSKIQNVSLSKKYLNK